MSSLDQQIRDQLNHLGEHHADPSGTLIPALTAALDALPPAGLAGNLLRHAIAPELGITERTQP